DTLNQNQITIKRLGKQYEYWNSNVKFSGVIKVQMSDVYCYQAIKDGEMISDGCTELKDKQDIFLWSNIAKDYNPDNFLTLEQLSFSASEKILPSHTKDSLTISEKVLTFNDVDYNGYVRQHDTLFFGSVAEVLIHYFQIFKSLNIKI